MNGPPPCGAISYEDNSMSGFANSFAGAVSSFPVVGSLMAGLVQPTYSIRQFRCVPGQTYDYRTFYPTENILAGIVFVLLIIAIYFRRK